MPNFIFQITSKFNFIKISVIIIGLVIVFAAIVLSNRSTKVGLPAIVGISLFVAFLVYYIRKGLKNEE